MKASRFPVLIPSTTKISGLAHALLLDMTSFLAFPCEGSRGAPDHHGSAHTRQIQEAGRLRGRATSEVQHSCAPTTARVPVRQRHGAIATEQSSCRWTRTPWWGRPPACTPVWVPLSAVLSGQNEWAAAHVGDPRASTGERPRRSACNSHGVVWSNISCH